MSKAVDRVQVEIKEATPHPADPYEMTERQHAWLVELANSSESAVNIAATAGKMHAIIFMCTFGAVGAILEGSPNYEVVTIVLVVLAALAKFSLWMSLKDLRVVSTHVAKLLAGFTVAVDSDAMTRTREEFEESLMVKVGRSERN